MLNDADCLRYGRQLLLPEWGERGQQSLAQKRVVIIGLGGLGCPALQYLAGAGVGNLRLVDGDRVSLSNLPRQTLYLPNQIGQSKAILAAHWVQRHNPGIRVEAVAAMATADALPGQLQGADLVLDCTDNLAARHAINAACVTRDIALVSGAAIGWQGQLLVVPPGISRDSGCFACLSEPASLADGEPGVGSCREVGVVGPVVAAVGALQALLALRLLLGLGTEACLHRFDGRQCHWQRYRLPRSPECAVCAASQGA